MKKAKKYIAKHFIVPTLRFYWKTFKPCSVGVRTIIENSKGEILFIRHSYKPKYYFPGGGLKKLEKAMDGAKREVKEEVNLVIDNLKLHGIYRGLEDSKNDWMFMYYAKIDHDEDLIIDDVEIEEFRWISPLNFAKFDIDKRCLKAVKDLIGADMIYTHDI